MKYFAVLAYRKEWWAFISRLIQFIEGKPYSHAAILVKFGINETIFDAEIPFTRKIPYSKWLESYKVISIYELKIENNDEEKALSVLSQLTWRPYSIIQALLIGVGRYWPWLAKKLKKAVINNDHAFQCSEFVAYFLCRFCDLKLDQTCDSIGLQELEIILNAIARKTE